MKIFTDEELEVPFDIPKVELPRIIDCLRYILSRTRRGVKNQQEHDSVVADLAKILHSIWMKADCCPASIRSIKRKIDEHLWPEYRRVAKQGLSDRKHKAKDKISTEPTRKSSRNQAQTDVADREGRESSESIKVKETVKSVTQKETPVEKKNTRFANEATKEFRKKWESEVGEEMFDIVSEEVIKERVKDGYCFDFEFYNDQKSRQRTQVMEIKKVTKSFQEEEKKRLNKKSRQYLRKQSAYGNYEVSEFEEFSEEEETEVDFEEEKVVQFSDKGVSSSAQQSLITTRSKSKKDSKKKAQLVSTSTQVCNTPKIPTKQGQTHDPRYLQAIGIMMSDGLSASQAIKSVYTIDTIVHEQDRSLPLEMDKEYTAARSKLKKLEKQVSLKSQMEEGDIESESDDESIFKVDQGAEIKKLKDLVEQKKLSAKQNAQNCLPDTRTARRNHYLMTVFVEGRIAEEMLNNESGTFIMPDGTTRNKVGEIAAMLVRVGDKMRAVKAQQIGRGDRPTWADTIVHMLSRLSLASGTDVKALWRSVQSILSDLCDVNKKLGKEIKGVIGSDWEPGQLFCVLHYVLHVPEAIKQVFSRYQESIGTDKLFPETTGFEMNVDEKIMVVQMLDIWMRLTSIRWHGRAWNKYELFTSYAEENGVRNVGHMVHANRFGEFEERCAGGVYLSEIWVKWLESYQSIRNNLSCYLRSVLGLMDICVFQWCAAALVGLHLTAPFLSMVIDHKVTQRQLLVILPSLYQELIAYPISFTCFDQPALPSLAQFWLPPFDRDTSPYGVDVMKRLECVVQTLDLCILDQCLKAICHQAAVILKRQRGDAYEFGDTKDSPDMIRKNLSEDMLDDPEATNTKKIENYLGNLDRLITTSGPQGFDKAADDLVLKYGRDLILESDMKWTSKKNRVAAKDLKVSQAQFREKQKLLKSNGLEDADIAIVTTENKIQRVVRQCKKSHGGPLVDISEIHDVNKFSDTSGDNKNLHSILNLEIRYRKFTMTNVKDSCPLFRQMNVSIETKVKNLQLLIEAQTMGCKASATMEDLESAVIQTAGINLETNVEAHDTFQIAQEDTVSSVVANESVGHFGASSSFWPPKPEEYVSILLEDGFYIAQVNDVREDKIWISYLKPKNDKVRTHWVWPDVEEKEWVEQDFVMEVYPALRIDSKLSTRRQVVYELLNEEIINVFVQFS